MKILYIIRGIPGSGKSTLAEKLAGESGRCEADDYFVEQNTGDYVFSPNDLGKAHAYCQNKVLRMMDENWNIIAVSNTFTRKWEMQPYYEMASIHRYEVIEIIVKSSFHSIHEISDETINRMQERFEY